MDINAMDDLPDLDDGSAQPTSCSEQNHNLPAMRNGDVHLNSSSAGHRCLEEDSEEEDDYDYDGIGDEDTDDATEMVEAFKGSQETKCLACNLVMESPERIMEHMVVAHQFNLVLVCVNCKVDQILFIKLINYIRTDRSAIEVVKSEGFDIITLDDSYMVPSKPDDAFLRFDIEDHLEELHKTGVLSELELAPLQSAAATSALVAENEQLKETISRLQALLKRTGEDMMSQSRFKREEVVGERSLENDAGYFDSYSSYEIHHEMLGDRVRTESYRDAILTNSGVLSGTRVLDLGCGTGVLSAFCAQAGAKEVQAIDMATVAYDAIDIIRKKGLDNTVKVTKGRLEDQHFPEKFDVIVSEWMGYFLLFEGMLDSVIYARDRFLKPGGLMLPNRCTMHLVALDDQELHKRFVTFWDDVYGLDMSSIGQKCIGQASTFDVLSTAVATGDSQIAELDISKCSTADTQFTSPFSLPALRDCRLTALAGYFDTFFDLPNAVSFSTGPLAKTTHWKQTVFFLPTPMDIKKGESVEGEISVKRHPHDVRALEVTFSITGKEPLRYIVD